MANNNMEMVIDFLVKLKPDIGQLGKVAKETEKILSKTNPEINFNSNKFVKEVREVADEMDSISKAADELQKGLEQIKLDPNFEEFEKALQQLNDGELADFIKGIESTIENFDTKKAQRELENLASEFDKTSADVQGLLDTQKKALAQMGVSGNTGSDEYKKLQKEIEQTEIKAKALQKAFGEINPTSFTDVMSKFEAIGDFAGEMDSFAQGAIESRDAMLNLQARTGATGEELARLKSMAEDAFLRGVGGSVAEAVNSVAVAQQALGDFFSPEQLLDFTNSAGGIAQVFDKDINEVIQGSRTFIKQFGLDGQEAGDLVGLAMQKSGSKMDDTLDTLDEYSQLVKLAGFNAQEFVGVLNTGLENGARDTDKIADAIKETQIRINAGDYSKPFDDMIESSTGAEKAIQENIKSILDQAASNQISVKDALQLSSEAISKGFEAGDINAALRDKLNVAISGTMAEDIGGELFTKIFSSKIDSSKITAQAKKAGEDISNALGPVTSLEKAQKQLELLGTKVGEVFAPIIAGGAGVLSSISGIAPAFQLVSKDGLDGLKTIQGGLGKATSASKAFAASFLTNPIVLTAAAIAGVVVATKLLADWINVTAKEKLESAKADQSLIDKQIEFNKSQIDTKKNNVDLVDSFKKQGAEAQKDAELMKQLSGAYPGVIDATKSYSENLTALQTASNKTQSELGKLDSQLANLSTKKIELGIQLKRIESNVIKADMEDALQEALLDDQSWLDPMAKAGQYISEFLFGTSASRQKAEEQMKSYTDGIYNAASAGDVKDAGIELVNAIFNGDGEFAKLLPKQREEMIQNVEKMVDSEIQVREKSASRLKDLAVDQLKNGRKEEDVIKSIQKIQKGTYEDAKKILDTTKQEVVAQKQKVDQLAKEEDTRKRIGTLASESLKKASEGFGEATDQITTLRLNIAQLEKDGKDTTWQKEQLNAAIATAKGYDKTIDNIEKYQKQTAKMFENKEPVNQLNLAKEAIAVTERKIAYDTKLYENQIKRDALLSGSVSSENDQYLIAEKNLKTQKAINAEWIKQLESRNLIKSDENSELGYKFVGMSKSDEREVIETLRNQKTEIESSELTLLQFKIDTAQMTKEINDRFKQMEIEDLTFKIQNESVDENFFGLTVGDLQRTGEMMTQVINKSKSDVVKLENEKIAALALLGDSATQAEIDKVTVKYDNLINTQKTELEKQIALEKTNKDTILNLNDIFYSRKLEKLQESLDKETQALEKKHADEISLQERFITAFDNAKDNVKSDDIQKINSKEKAKLAALESSLKSQLITQEDYEAQKAIIIEKANAKREKAEKDFEKAQRLRDNLNKGMELASLTSYEAEGAKIRQSAILDEIALLKDKQLTQGGFLSVADQDQLKKLQSEYDEVQKIIRKNSDIVYIGLGELGSSLATSMTALIAGDGEGALNSLKGFMQKFSGVLLKGLIDLADKKILEMTLKALGIGPLDPVSVLVVAPALYAAVSGIVHAIADPILQPLSYASGGRIDSPTTIIAGDGSKLGSRNREWIFNDPQLIATVQMAAMGSNIPLINELKRLNSKMDSLELKVKLRGTDLEISRKRTNVVESRRTR